MQPFVNVSIHSAWLALGLVWAAGAISAKPNVRKEPENSRIGHILTMAAAFTLLFSAPARIGPLEWRALPPSPALDAMGLLLTLAGLAFAAWARLLLGHNWSAIVALKQGHTLVRKGPYAIVRHPIYTGMLLAMLGTALVSGELGALLGVTVAFAALLAKARLEETFLLSRFGDEYWRYRRQVCTLIPFVL